MKKRLLITSVGSLVGQNILDALIPHRESLHIIGLNSVAENARNFRCDVCYLVDETKSLKFREQLLSIIQNEKPDIILPGRDLDTIFLSDLKTEFTDLFEDCIPFGTSFIPKITMNKFESYKYFSERDLPFVKTIEINSDNTDREIKKFVETIGFPLVVKPTFGFGSNDVYFVFNWKQLKKISRKSGFVIQEYLGNPEIFLNYMDVFEYGLPLFFQIPEPNHFAVQSFIYKDGSTEPVLVTQNTMVLGRAEYAIRVEIPALVTIAKPILDQLFSDGWYGPVNLQFKQDKNDNWLVFELNPRYTGTTSARHLLGFEEVLFSINPKEPKNLDMSKQDIIIYKYLTDFPIDTSNVQTLKKDGKWRKS